MPRSIRKWGTNIFRPGVVTHHNLAGLVNLDLGDESAVFVIGEADAGQPQAAATSPVVHEFTDPQDMIDLFQGGNLAEAARCLFTPAMDGQNEQEVPIGGARTVYAVKTNQSTQASYQLRATYPAGAAALTLYDRYWGLLGNSTWWKMEVSGTGLLLTIGRDVEPDIGEQASKLFSITGVDEWISVTTTAAFTGVSCTVDYNIATPGHLILNSSVAAEDLDITVGTKTVAEVIAEINAHDPHGTGAVYLATILRADRTNVQFSYADNQTAVDCLSPAAPSFEGVSYDIVEWVNANSYYCTATWNAGPEAQPGTKTKTYLSGGATGLTSNISYVQDALKVAARMSPRLIASGYNAAINGGAITLAAVNSEFTDHATRCNATGVPCERQVFITNDDTTKAAMYATIGALNNEYVAVVNNEIYREDETGTKAWLGSHCAAATAAAIMAGSPIATPLTHKYIKASDIRFVATDFDPTDETDFSNGINYGLLFLETVPGTGFRFAKGISTYRLEDNDGRIHLEVVEARIRHKIILRRALDVPFIGHKGAGLRTAKAIERKILEAHRAMADPNDPDFILVSGTDANGDEVPAYRNIRVRIAGPAVYVSGEVTFTIGVTWIFNDFSAALPSAIVG